jgi:hypothetical protein
MRTFRLPQIDMRLFPGGVMCSANCDIQQLITSCDCRVIFTLNTFWEDSSGLTITILRMNSKGINAGHSYKLQSSSAKYVNLAF